MSQHNSNQVPHVPRKMQNVHHRHHYHHFSIQKFEGLECRCRICSSVSFGLVRLKFPCQRPAFGLPVPDLDPALGHKGKRERWLPTNSIEFGSCGLSGLRSWLMPPFVRRPHQLLNVHITSVKMNWDNPTRAELSPYYRLTMGADPCLEGLKTFQSSWQNHV